MPEWFRKQERKPLHGVRIEDYAVIGDLETAALVSREGSIDWLCWPNFASGACFAALLGTQDNGYWSLRPRDKIAAIQRRYRPGTLILETTFTTSSGELLLTDFMPPRGKHSDVVRIVRCTRGKVAIRMELALRFDYGLTVPWVTSSDHELRAIAGPNMVVLRSSCTHAKPAELHGENFTTVSEFTLRAGQQQCFVLTYASSIEDVPEPVPIDSAFNDTETFWREWIGRSQYEGPYK
ncbi:MAG TPA: trehalase-like domain-containing protein, partial [Bryobacteraceae bacterium]